LAVIFEKHQRMKTILIRTGKWKLFLIMIFGPLLPTSIFEIGNSFYTGSTPGILNSPMWLATLYAVWIGWNYQIITKLQSDIEVVKFIRVVPVLTILGIIAVSIVGLELVPFYPTGSTILTLTKAGTVILLLYLIYCSSRTLLSIDGKGVSNNDLFVQMVIMVCMPVAIFVVQPKINEAYQRQLKKNYSPTPAIK
jgi:hypothetical protein